jgi:hypothetical protein
MSDAPVNEDSGIGQQQHSAIKNTAVVQCDGFRCLAYRDGDIWREFETGKELTGVLSVVFTFTA